MRINLFGGPSSGKSTTAARLFSELKERRVSIEHVGEYVKSWAYQKREIKKYDQVYLFGKQQQYEYRYLSTGVKNIVTDSPCFLSVVYGAKFSGGDYMAEAIGTLCKLYDEDYPCTNIFIHRGKKEYVAEGRYQTYEEAKELDLYMLSLLKNYYPHNVIELDYLDKEGILKTALKVVE